MPLACEMPPALVTPSMSLTSAAAALTSNGGLNILALGSGSTVGDAAGTGGGPAYSRPDSSFPYRMQAALEALRPGARFNLTVRGDRKSVV